MSVEEGERGTALPKWKDPVGDFVNGEVLADIPLGGFPHEGAFRGVESDQEGAVTLGRPKGGSVGN